MNLEEIKYFSQDNIFVRSLEVAVVKTAQAISGDEPGARKTLAGKVLDDSMWAREKFSVNAASQSSVNSLVAVSWVNDKPIFTYPEVRADFDTALDNACSAIWNAEAKV